MRTWFPILVLPVKETRGTRVSFAMVAPTSAPPQTRLHIPPGKLFCSRTWAMILVVAILHRGVVGADFQIKVFPQTYDKANNLSVNIPLQLIETLLLTKERALFQPYTATGKLNAVITPTIPRGFHISRSAWLGLSEGITFPSNILESPTA